MPDEPFKNPRGSNDRVMGTFTRAALLVGASSVVVASFALPGGGLFRRIGNRLSSARSVRSEEGELASFDGATGWLNSEPLTPEALRGRVVLVDFWTYTCINWLRTLPYVRAWAAKYAGAGLTIVGVHTPEFGFEHDLDNVTAACQSLEVGYPVALDNDYAVWNAFSNSYWPAVYLSDVNGTIQYHHFGEGEYEATERAIQQLLIEAGAVDIDQSLVSVEPLGLEVAANWGSVKSPETYFGYGQSRGFAQDDNAKRDEPTDYAAVSSLSLNSWALSGNWTVAEHAAISNQPGNRVAFQFHARDLNLVMRPATNGASIRFRVLLDGEPAAGSFGYDVDTDGRGVMSFPRTYQLIRQQGDLESRRFEIEFDDAGAEVYCITFG